MAVDVHCLGWVRANDGTKTAVVVYCDGIRACWSKIIRINKQLIGRRSPLRREWTSPIDRYLVERFKSVLDLAHETLHLYSPREQLHWHGKDSLEDKIIYVARVFGLSEIFSEIDRIWKKVAPELGKIKGKKYILITSAHKDLDKLQVENRLARLKALPFTLRDYS